MSKELASSAGYLIARERCRSLTRSGLGQQMLNAVFFFSQLFQRDVDALL